MSPTRIRSLSALLIGLLASLGVQAAAAIEVPAAEPPTAADVAPAPLPRADAFPSGSGTRDPPAGINGWQRSPLARLPLSIAASALPPSGSGTREPPAGTNGWQAESRRPLPLTGR